MRKRLEINYTKLWRAWAKTKPMCQCGCKTNIVLSYRNFCRNMVKKGEPPKYILAHYPKKEKKYQKWYKKWLESSPICVCGCGTSLKLCYDSFAKITMRFGEPPIFYRDHGTKLLKTKKLFSPKIKEEIKPTEEICEIIQAINGRCSRYIQCPSFLSNKCLDKAIKNRWVGWRSKKYG